jgi:hypothetical protein
MIFNQQSVSTISPFNTDPANASALSVAAPSGLKDVLDGSQRRFATASAAAANEISLPSQIDGTLTPNNGLIQLSSLIDGSHRQRFYRWTTGGNVNLALTGLSQDIDLQLLDDGGIEVARSSHAGRSNESINLINLPQDTYFIRVFDPDSTASQTNFTLRASNNTISDLIARENAPTDNDIPNLNNTLTFSGIVSNRDSSDLLRFRLPSSGTIQVNLALLNNPFLSPFNPHIGVRLIKQIHDSSHDDGFIEGDEVVSSSQNVFASITAPGVFQFSSAPSDDYWVQVYQDPSGDPDSGDPTLPASSYNLTIRKL